ncbi:MAG TPA: DinB family protein [Terriglobales bacterium]|jgi:uncharacterized damage-inducible protein DinB|nr:DinB family protein [Terriglobales bacterium]
MKQISVLASRFSLLILLIASLVIPASSQGASAPPAPAPTSGVRAEFLDDLKVQEDKYVSLAQAIPADKYTWRPAEGVRSISEVFLHVAAANYNLPKLFGVQPPADFKVQGFDKSTTDKAKVVQTLQDAFAHMRTAVVGMPESDMDKLVSFRGGKKSTRAVLVFILEHNAEHLGQSIAYARMNGVTPPWTEEQQKKAQSQSKQ